LLDNPRAFEAVQKLTAIAAEKGIPVSQLALAWTLQQPGITSSIIGPRTREQLIDNVSALEVRLSREELARIDAISPPGDVIVPFYQAEFGPHPQHW
jgi:aryl-alcohol dehydrogenase-like predicted oxidoreductase